MVDTLIIGFEWYIVFLFSTVLHEAAHALVAMKLGDRTAFYGGQVTLDPVPHVRREPFGLIIVPILSYMVSGWMLGWASAPYNPVWAERYPRRAAWMALAGPVANLFLVLLAALIIRIGMIFNVFDAPARIQKLYEVTESVHDGAFKGVAVIVSIMFSLNLLLFVFNLIPLPPLDGSAIVPLFLNHEATQRYREFLRSPMVTTIGLVIAWQLFRPLFTPIHLLALNLLYPGMGYH